MYKDQSSDPLYIFNGKELRAMADMSGCSDKLKDWMNQNAYYGDAIFCNNKIKVKVLDYILLQRKGKRQKESTRVLFNQYLPELNLSIYSILLL